jgi:endonuclease YncB( thermonuclease family)
VTRRTRVSSISPPVKRARKPSAERPPAAADSLHAIKPEEERVVTGTIRVATAGSPIAAASTDFWPISWPTFEVSRLVYVIDGDTQVFDYVADMGFQKVTFQAVVRLLGVNCPEKKGRTAEAGKRATKFSEDWLAGKLTGGHPLFLRLRPEQKGRLDAFGRLLGVVETYDSERKTLQRALIESGNAIKFMTEEATE